MGQELLATSEVPMEGRRARAGAEASLRVPIRKGKEHRSPRGDGRVKPFGNRKVLWTVRACFIVRAFALPFPEHLVVTVKAQTAFSRVVLTLIISLAL